MLMYKAGSRGSFLHSICEQNAGALTCIPFTIWFIQRILWHAFQEQLKDGRRVFLSIVSKNMHWRLAPEGDNQVRQNKTKKQSFSSQIYEEFKERGCVAAEMGFRGRCQCT